VLPNGNGAIKQPFALTRERQYPTAPVRWIPGHLDQSATFKRLQRGRQGGAIHGEQRRYCTHRRRLGTIESHQERELTISEVEWPQSFIEAPGQSAGGTLYVEAQTGISNAEGDMIRKHFCA
jgi:hypothetical protein